MTYYSIAEQHFNGDWWYHPKLTFDSKEKAEDGFKTHFWWDLERPHKILEHQKPFPQENDWYTTDFENWFENFTDKPLYLKCNVISISR